jgi:hypothetical protein
MAVNDKRDRNGASLVQSFMTGEKKSCSVWKPASLAARSESKKADATILSGVN